MPFVVFYACSGRLTMSKTSERDRTYPAHPYLSAIVEATDDAIVTTTPDGTITSWNPAAEHLLGYTAGEVMHTQIFCIIPRSIAAKIRGMMGRARRGERTSHVETKLTGRDKQNVDVALTISPVRDKTGRVVSLLTIARDISRRKKGIQTRLQRNRELLTLHRLSEIMLSSRSLTESCRAIVEEICAATGFPNAAIALYDKPRQTIVFMGLKSRAVWRGDPMPEASIDQTMSGIVIQSGKPLVETDLPHHPEYRHRIKRWGSVATFVGYPMKVGRTVIGCLNLVHTRSVEISPDTARWIESLANYVAVLTERKRAAEELFRSREQLRELSRHVDSAIEEERKRIAREIHDQLGQELSLLQLELGAVRDGLPASAKQLRAQAKSMTKMIDSAIHSVQRISTDLRPAILDNLGIGAAVDWATKEFQKRTKIRCRVTVAPPDLKLDQNRSTALFRILQEALTNILRHAQATRVELRLVKKNGAVTLEVRDNGVGISHHRIADPKSVGLTGMRERVHPWGGSVAITGRPGRGTEITATIPLSP
jgi:PAS domain S-box-containing protein